LYKFLEATVIYLKENYPDNSEVNEIINEAESLKFDISKETKAVIIRRFSKTFARIRKFNPLTFKEVYDVAKKEVIKYLLLKGVENLPQLVSKIAI